VCEDKTFLAIIPARGGSKRLPRKNVLDLCGKPLIAWSIEAGLNCKYIDKVVVSSDDDEILAIAKRYGAETIKRPDELASDTAITFDAVKHTIENVEKYDYVVLLQPTSPLREEKHIVEAIELLESKNANAVISVCEMDHNPLWSNTLPKDGNMSRFLRDEVLNKRSQDLEKYYRLNGAIYICKTDKLLKEKSFMLKERIFAYIVDRESSIDIDEEIDFKIAEIFKNINCSENQELNFLEDKKNKFIEDINYLENKYEKYIKELTFILNNLHGTNYSKNFWQKSFGLGFRRYLHMSYDGYLYSKSQDDNAIESILSCEDYKVPIDFEEHRQFFQNTNMGSYQLYSIYLKTFHPDEYNFSSKSEEPDSQKVNIQKKYSIWNRIKKIDFDKIFKRVLKFLYKNKKPKVLILDSYFSNKHRNELYIKTSGLIADYQLEQIQQENSFNIKKRFNCFNSINAEDDFDRYFKNYLIHTFPKFFVENFDTNLNHYKNLVADLSTNYIISEGWISNTHLSFFLALAKEIKNIKHIYNEHNYLEHQFIGNHNFLIADMVDVFYTLGWQADDQHNNMKKGASLFPFVEKNYKFNNDNMILYISASPSKKIEEFNSAYGENGENGFYYLKFIEKFFKILKPKICEQLLYRAYPSREDWLEHSKDDYIDFKKIKNIDDFKFHGKKMMLNSKLVIIDYLATSYLESLTMNIPTIIFWNQDTYYLTDEYNDFFDELVSCGICQTSPKKAAKFVNELVENDSIEEWWYSDKTQNARKAFLDTNIGDPKDAIDFYLSLAKE
jgi:CMP-N,N'-diacetyllegionaminic acid synthase